MKKQAISLICILAVTISFWGIFAYILWNDSYNTNEYRSASKFPDWRSAYGFTSSMEKVQLKINREHFLIPKAYIESKDDWEDGKTFTIKMHALLPDLLPYSENNKKYFEEGSDTIKWHLYGDRLFHYPHADAYTEWFQKIKQEAKKEKDSQNNVYGLRRFEDNQGHTIYFRDLTEKDIFTIICDNKWNSCSVDRHFEDLWLRYSYSREYLKEWRTIDEKINALNLSFKGTESY